MKKKQHKEMELPSFRASVSRLEKIVLGYVPEDEGKVQKDIQHELKVEGVYK